MPSRGLLEFRVGVSVQGKGRGGNSFPGITTDIRQREFGCSKEKR